MSQARRSDASLIRRVTGRWPVATFSAFVLGLAGLVMLAGLDAETTPFALVLLIPLSAILTAALVGGRSMVRGLFARIIRWQVPARWYLAAIGIPLAPSPAAIPAASPATSPPAAARTAAADAAIAAAAITADAASTTAADAAAHAPAVASATTIRRLASAVIRSQDSRTAHLGTNGA
jgi:hypothetical protein